MRTRASHGIPSPVRVIQIDQAPDLARNLAESNIMSSTLNSEMAAGDQELDRKVPFQPLSIDTKLSLKDVGGLFSPSLRAIQDYYRQYAGSPGSTPLTAAQLDKGTPIELQVLDGPRRHSLMMFSTSPETPRARDDNERRTRSSRLRDSEQITTQSTPKSSGSKEVQSAETNSELTTKPNLNEVVIPHPSVQSKIFNPLSPKLIGCLPYEYTHERLRQWGAIYRSNQATADAFIKAVPLTAFQLSPSSAKNVEGLDQTDCINVCVRIIPANKERKTSLIRKDFSPAQIPNMRKITDFRTPSPINKLNTKPQLRSRSICAPPSPKRSHRLASASSPSSPAERLKSTFRLLQIEDSDTHAVHIEYALHRLPLLAAVLLSGHILRGDTIELPLPHPSAWPNVVRWMYVFDTALDDEMRENISYLAGNPGELT
ncbi:MAG: hypothetical protein M4579_002435 [Chaenotheca gracillima]|nr:MAG: hypothetical protein M4579_002435 [Chaenotheca gracillima]